MRLFFVFRAAWHKYPAAVSVLVVVEQYIFIASNSFCEITTPTEAFRG